MTARKEFHDLTPLDKARELLAPLAPGPRMERVPLDEAAGRVLAEAVDAPIDVPGFARAAMDGYAVRAEDTVGAEEADPVRLRLAGAVPPGRRPDVEVGPGRAVEVSTGAVLPEGADAVVMVEDTEVEEGASDAGGGEGRGEGGDEEPPVVLVRRAVAPGTHVAARGSDVAAGERVLPRGRLLDARDVGLLAAVGVAEVPVHVPPTVALVSTGDEVRPVEEALGPGQIHDVNAHSLGAAVREAGGRPVHAGRVGDDEEAMAEVLAEAAEAADLVVTSGSTSASQVDVLHRVVEERGELLFHGLHVKPGKPTFAARLAGTGVVGLPGYPVSALMTFRLLVAPLIRRTVGRPAEPREETVRAHIAHRVRTAAGRPWLLPVGLVGTGPDESQGHGLMAYPVERGSGATTSLADADGYVLVPADVQRLDEGDEVDVVLFTRRAPADLVGMGGHCPALNALLDRVEGDVKWLRTGGREALRRAGLGVPDAAAAPLPEGTDPGEAAPDGYRVEAVWHRTLGVAVRPDDEDASVDAAAGWDGLDDVVTARFAPGSATRDLVEKAAADAGATPRWTGAHRSHDASALAVAEGTVDAAVVLEAVANRHGLAFAPLLRDAFAVWTREDRADKPGVRALLAALEDDGFWAAVAELPGYRKG